MYKFNFDTMYINEVNKILFVIFIKLKGATLNLNKGIYYNWNYNKIIFNIILIGLTKNYLQKTNKN